MSPRSVSHTYTTPHTHTTVSRSISDLRSGERVGATEEKDHPNLALVVVIAGEQETTGDGEGDGGDTTEDLFVLDFRERGRSVSRLGRTQGGGKRGKKKNGWTDGVLVQLSIGSNVEQATGGIVGAGAKGVAIGKELDGVDVRQVAGESLNGLAGPNIPQLGKAIAGAGDEDVLVGGVDADAHDVTEVVGELGDARAGVDIPQHAGHVAGRGEDATVVDEAAAGKVAGVAGELARDPGRPFPSGEVVDGADVVEAAAGDVIAARGVGACHDPGRSQGNGMDFVGRVGIPDDELAVLGGRDEMSTIGRPMHSVDLGQMALQGLSRLHADPVQWLGVFAGHLTYCRTPPHVSPVGEASRPACARPGR